MQGDHKYIEGSDGREELFDIAADPLETRDLVERQGELASSMREVLHAYHDSLNLCEKDPGAEVELTLQRRELLRSLGYLE